MAEFLPYIGSFPNRRMRRNRDGQHIRTMLQENHITPAQLIWPIFVCAGLGQRVEIPRMKGVYRYSIDQLDDILAMAKNLKINALAIFPYIEAALKNPEASEATNPNNIVCEALRYIRSKDKQIMLLSDVALDPFNSTGHDGLLDENGGHDGTGYVLNDETIEILKIQALMQAQAGSDCIAPSDMMDGRVGAIRAHLDQHQMQHIRIIAYAAKFASSLYAPFRDAVGASHLVGGNKKNYQLNPTNAQEALHEIALDLQEGADIVMVKPGLPYLDIIWRAHDLFKAPIFAYQVSGEYAMLKLAMDQGIIEAEPALLEIFYGFRRAGAQAIMTYFAPDIAKILLQRSI